MTTDSRILSVNFEVPENLNHTWIVTHRTDICTVTGIPGQQKVLLTTGHFDLDDTFSPAIPAASRHTRSQFQDWLAESIKELRTFCLP